MTDCQIQINRKLTKKRIAVYAFPAVATLQRSGIEKPEFTALARYALFLCLLLFNLVELHLIKLHYGGCGKRSLLACRSVNTVFSNTLNTLTAHELRSVSGVFN